MGKAQTIETIELPVTLDHPLGKPEDDNNLVIRGGDHHLVFQSGEVPRMRQIVWKLEENAAEGRFCAVNDPLSPGFSWLVRTPEAAYLNLQTSLCGPEKLTVSHLHVGQQSKGHWFYQLFAWFPNGRIYGVPLTFTAGPAGNQNPSIKNR